MTPHGTYTTVDGRPAVRFERRLRHPVESVWRTVTEPSELRHWFPCTVEVEALRAGAPMRFAFAPDSVLEGEVLEIDPPRVFAFRWGADRVRMEVRPDGDGARLEFLHVLYGDGDDAGARTAAGWHVCLDALAAALDGEPVDEGPGGATPEWRARYDEYVAAGVPSGAEIPGLA